MFTLLESVIDQLSSGEVRQQVAQDRIELLSEASLRRRRAASDGEPDQLRTEDLAPPDNLGALAATLRAGEQKAISRELFNRALTFADDVRRERLHQARRAFSAALALTVVSIVVVLASFALLLTHKALAGLVMTSIGTTCQIIGLVLFRLSKEANDRLDAVAADITTLTNAALALDLLDLIADRDSRDRAVAEAVRWITMGSYAPGPRPTGREGDST